MTSPTQAYASSKENIFVVEDKDDFGMKLAGKIKDWTLYTQGTPFALHYSNVGVAYTHLYGLDVEGKGANAAVITRSGQQGSIAEMRVPTVAGDLRKVWNVIVGPELAWTAVATTNDYASRAQAITAKNALQYYLADKGVSAKAKKQAFYALGLGEAALHIPWNEELGEDAGLEPILDEKGQPVLEDGKPQMRITKSGDIDFRAVATWDIIRDPTAKSYDTLPGIVIREWQNKYEVSERAKRNGNWRAANDALTIGYQPSETYRFWRPFNTGGAPISDFIPVYYLYHKRTGAVPRGRMTEVLDNGSVIFDSELPKCYWEIIPVVRMAVGEYEGTPFPYTKFFGACGIQQATDGLRRDLLTNATQVSGGVIYVEEDSDISPAQLGTGPQIMTGKKGMPPPKALDLQVSHPEHFKLEQTLQANGRSLLGLDNLTAGQDVGETLSGAAMAVMTSTTVQNNSQEQSDWGNFMQNSGNVVLAHIKYNMSEPRKIALAGKANADLVTTTELSGEKVAGIDRLQVQLAPALQQTAAGKQQMAEIALKEGWAKTPQQAQAVFDSGRLDTLTQGLSSELLLISSENEALANGESVPVMDSDNHRLHLNMDGGHPTVTASLTARRNKKVVDAVNAHKQQHIDFLKKTDPKILELYGQPSLASPPPVGPPPPNDSTKMAMAKLATDKGWAPNAQAAEQVFETGKLDAAQPPAQPPIQAPPQQPPQQANAARLPLNPATGQPAGPVAGTVSPSLAIRPPGVTKPS